MNPDLMEKVRDKLQPKYGTDFVLNSDVIEAAFKVATEEIRDYLRSNADAQVEPDEWKSAADWIDSQFMTKEKLNK